MFFQIILFIISIFALSWLSSRLISTLVAVAKYLQWREFIVGFFIMAFATSLPNLFVDINAALHGFPQLALGDVVGGNLVDLTLVLALAILFSPRSISAKSDMVQKSAIFTIIIALLPLFLIFDRNLSRLDGAILIGAFVIYSGWIFSKQDNFQKVYRKTKSDEKTGVFWLLRNVIKLIFLLALLVAASFVIIDIAQFFSNAFGASLALVGILIVGLGNCFPEMYFAIISARRGDGWMVLGNLMGSVIVCTTLVLGIIGLISPFTINDLSPFLITRVAMLVAVGFYLYFIRSDKKLTKIEALVLLLIYIAFLLAEIFVK